MATKRKGKKKAAKKAQPRKLKKKTTNPNGANQYQLDPRQKLCWDLYVNPRSETFGNAYQSAIKAGYKPKTAKCITVETWFMEKTRRLNLLNKAEDVLEECLDMPTESYTSDITGEKEAIITSPALIKIKQDTAKFVAERIGKEFYSSRTELTDKDGEKLIPDTMTQEKANEALKQYMDGIVKNTGGK